MKLAAAALAAAMLFLFVALGGQGNASLVSQGVPEAILLAGVPTPPAASAGAAAVPTSTSGATGPLVAVGRSVLAMQLSQSGTAPQANAAAAPLITSADRGTPGARHTTVATPPQVTTASNGATIETLPAPTMLVYPAPPTVSTSIGPATPTPVPTPTPAPTSTVTPSPGPSPTAAPFPSRQSLFRSVLGRL